MQPEKVHLCTMLNRPHNFVERPFVGWWLVLALMALPLAAAAQNDLSADEIMQRAVHRAATHESMPAYLYTKRTLTEELDGSGNVKNRAERLYQVLVESGASYLKLTRVNGQDLSAAQLKKQEDRELAQRQKLADAPEGKRGDERENFVTAELVDKYNFTLLGRETFNGRTVYALSFAAKTNLPSHKLTDRFLNHIAGKVWVDADEFEIAKLDLHLTAEVTLWGGMIGTLRQGTYSLERTRLADGAWFDSASRGTFEGRKLLEPMLLRTRSDSSDFRRRDVASK